MRRAGSSVAAGAAALAAAGLMAKALSAVSRVLVARWLGAETVGLYEMAAPVLATGLSLCTLGLPVAASALIAAALGRGDAAAGTRLLRATRLLLLLGGVAAAVAVALLAGPLAGLFGNPEAAGALRGIAPAIALAALLAGERSWLQAGGRVPASAAVLAVEQAARVAVALWAALACAHLAGSHPAGAAAALAWSPGAGAAAGLAACLLLRRRPTPATSRPPAAQGPRPWRLLLRGGLPNWASGAMSALTTAIDVPLITWRLRAAGLDADAATAALGRLNGMAMPLAAGPAVLFGAVASALVPAAAADWARGDGRAVRRRGEGAYFWVLAAAAPCALALWQLAQPLSQLLYRNPAAAAPLAVLALLGVPLGLSYVAAALANAVGRPQAEVSRSTVADLSSAPANTPGRRAWGLPTALARAAAT